MKRWNTDQNEIVDVTRRFYVSACRMGNSRGVLVAGPYETHAAALDDVWKVKAKCEEIDPVNTSWMAFGTASAPREDHPPTLFGVKGISIAAS